MKEIKVRKLNSFLDKSVGLLSNDKPEAVFFKTHFGIHTFFMKFAIDVVILDKLDRVVSLKEHLKPNRIFMWNPVHEVVLELPVGTIEKLQLSKNQKIKLSLCSSSTQQKQR